MEQFNNPEIQIAWDMSVSKGPRIGLTFEEWRLLKAKADMFEEIYAVHDNGGTDFEVAQCMRIILNRYDRAQQLTEKK